jgi:hypothetical protein
MNTKFKEIAIQLFKDAYEKSILEHHYWSFLEENDIDTDEEGVDEDYSHPDGKDSYWCLDKLFYFIEQYKAGEESCDSFVSENFEPPTSVEYCDPLYEEYIYIIGCLHEAREKNDDYENKLNSEAETFLNFCIEFYYETCDNCHSDGCNSYFLDELCEDDEIIDCEYIKNEDGILIEVFYRLKHNGEKTEVTEINGIAIEEFKKNFRCKYLGKLHNSHPLICTSPWDDIWNKEWD